LFGLILQYLTIKLQTIPSAVWQALFQVSISALWNISGPFHDQAGAPLTDGWNNAKIMSLDIDLKVLEHRKLGWKVLILKYDLGKSLSKEMWCKMADIKTKFTTYFERWQMHVIWGKSFLCPWTRKMISPHNEWYIEMSWLVHIFLQN